MLQNKTLLEIEAKKNIEQINSTITTALNGYKGEVNEINDLLKLLNK